MSQPDTEAQPLSIYPEVNKMVRRLLRACPDFDPARAAAIEPGARRLMYELGHYVMEKIEAGESDSLAPLCEALEKAVGRGGLAVRTELGVFMGCVAACGKTNNISPEPFRSQLGEKGQQFWQETIEFHESIGPLRYEEGTY